MHPLPTDASFLAMPRRIFCVGYSNAYGPTNKVPKLHQTRDGTAAMELMAVLAHHGYDYETTLHFYPDLARPADNFSVLRPDDLLLLPTRPPIELWLSNGKIPPGRRLMPGRNDLEKAIFTAIAPFFTVVSRFNMQLSAAVAAWLKDNHQDHAVLDFTDYSHAFITYLSCVDEPHGFGHKVDPRLRLTAGYFIKLRAIPNFGCGLICSFGISGVENLLFARQVRRCHPQWLAPDWQGFGMLRFTVPIAAEDTPLSAANFDDEIVGELLAEHPFDLPPPRA